MDDRSTNNAVGSADARAARIARMADAIIADAKKRDAERLHRNEMEMEKFKRWYATSAEQPAGGPPWKP